VKLHGSVDHALRGLGRCQLGHRGLARRSNAACVTHPGGAINEQRCRVDRGRHVAKRCLR